MMERTNEQKLADALMWIMLTEAAPDAYSRAEGNEAWGEALDALRGHIPDFAYQLVEEAAKEYRALDEEERERNEAEERNE